MRCVRSKGSATATCPRRERLLSGAVADEVCNELSAMFDELAALAEALRTLGDLTPRSLDAIASLGEQLSSVLVVAAFASAGCRRSISMRGR